MKLTKLTLVVACLFFFMGSTVETLKAQDIHFSQFYLSPLNLNPALTGVMSCNHRFVANYRNQWASILKGNAYNTYSVSYDMRRPVGRYDNFGVGVTFWGDRAGESQFSTLEAKVSGAYAKRISGYRKKSNYISVGAELGFAQRSINFLNLRYGTQNDGGVFNPGFASLEDFAFDNFLFADLSAGLLWYSILNETNNWYLGATFSHLNRADQSFDDDPEIDESLYSKVTLHAGADFMLTDRMGLVPGAVIFLQGPSTQINGGTSIKLKLGNGRVNTQAFHLGLWARISNTYKKSIHADALILSTRFDYNTFSLGFSYDVNVSSLAVASNTNGAYELSLVYKICNPDRRGVFCPDF